MGTTKSAAQSLAGLHPMAAQQLRQELREVYERWVAPAESLEREEAEVRRLRGVVAEKEREAKEANEAYYRALSQLNRKKWPPMDRDILTAIDDGDGA
jgi:hypothetical protein